MEEYIFYEIRSLNSDITHTYIGHTKNFTRRKWEHHSRYNCGNIWKIYETIRLNGGWEEWEMVPIDKQEFESKLDARIHEQKLIDERGSKLNVDSAFSTYEKKKEIWKKSHCKNHDKRIAQHRKWLEDNKEQQKNYTAEYRAKNRDIINQKQREYRLKKKQEKENI